MIRLTRKERSFILEEGQLGDDGTYWIYFKPGYYDKTTDCIGLHEDTKAQAYTRLRDLVNDNMLEFRSK